MLCAKKRVQKADDSVRTHRHFYVRCRFARLQNEFALNFVGFFRAYVRNLVFIAIAEHIEPQTIAGRINALFQFVLEQFVLAVIQHTFEHGILHPRSMSNAFLGNVSQALPSGRRGCIDVVCDQNQ